MRNGLIGARVANIAGVIQCASAACRIVVVNEHVVGVVELCGKGGNVGACSRYIGEIPIEVRIGKGRIAHGLCRGRSAPVNKVRYADAAVEEESDFVGLGPVVKVCDDITAKAVGFPEREDIITGPPR